MTTDEKFAIILSKNRLARSIRNMFREAHNDYKISNVPEVIKFDFDEIEKLTGVMNQPTARQILESKMDL